MSEHKLPRPPKLPTVQEQQFSKFGRNFTCKDCLHAYRVYDANGNESLNCYQAPPGMQFVTTLNALRQPVEGQRQWWASVGPDQFCHQFQEDIREVQKPGLLTAN